MWPLRLVRVSSISAMVAACASMTGTAQSGASATEPDTDLETSARASARTSTGDRESGVFVGTVAAHNRARAKVGAPPLHWSNQLARYAQKWADHMARDCTLRHRGSGPYGENLGAAASNAGAPTSSPDQVVAHWTSEKQCWKYGAFMQTDHCSASCAAGLKSTGCGHYTQVIWSGTRRVGCGRATCSKHGMDWEFWVCNYDPHGNVVGEKPY